jgi:serine/threonine protein phosphatase 1
MSWMKGVYAGWRNISDNGKDHSSSQGGKAGEGAESPAVKARLPEGVRIYAVGDVHGRVDLLRKLQKLLLEDAQAAAEVTRKIVVYLGDYIDRGQQSREVLDLLIGEPLPSFQSIFLQGNHEAAMLEFLEDASAGPSWFSVGGDATALSYNTAIPREFSGDERFASIRLALLGNLPAEHLTFLRALKLMFIAGDYVFVHAGLRPGVPLRAQASRDLLWIRDSFLSHGGPFEKVVVHGHSLSHKPEVRDNRIGIDTGAYATNILTALVLERESSRFIDTGDS